MTASTKSVHAVINAVKEDLGGFLTDPVVLRQNADKIAKCKTAGGVEIVYIKPKLIKLTLKTVSGYEHDPTVGLAAPLGVLAINPSYSGAYSRAATQSMEIDLNAVGLVSPQLDNGAPGVARIDQVKWVSPTLTDTLLEPSSVFRTLPG